MVAARPSPGPWLSRALRTLKIGFWVGYQVQSNWTDPLLFFIYSVARPIGGALILVFMFFVVAGGRRGELLDFFVVGSALWPFVVFTMLGMGWGVLEDREHFKVIRYIYSSPIPFWVFVVGRGFAQAVTGLPAMLITLALGFLVLHVPLSLPLERIPYLLAAFGLGVVALVAVGMVLVGATFMISGEAWRMPEAVGQAFFLLCGAVFPVPVLPNVLERVAAVIPLTYWLEAMRRSLLGPGAVRSFPALADGQVLERLLLTTAGAVVLGAIAFTVGLGRARQKGILDAETGY